MVRNADRDDGGWYQCTAYNSEGSTVTRARIVVNVPEEPIVKPAPVKIPKPEHRRVIEEEK